MHTSAALSISSSRDDTELVLRVLSTNFLGNNRALDIAMKGLGEVVLRDSLFQDNAARLCVVCSFLIVSTFE